MWYLYMFFAVASDLQEMSISNCFLLCRFQDFSFDMLSDYFFVYISQGECVTRSALFLHFERGGFT